MRLPTLTLGFSYDGKEIMQDDADPRLVEDGGILTLIRDDGWETACATSLMEAGLCRWMNWNSTGRVSA